MRRRTFLLGSLLAASAAAAWWRRRDAAAGTGGAPLPDGRWLVREAGLAFGTTVVVSVVHGDRRLARHAAGRALEAIRGVDRRLTVYRPDSEVGRLNAAGRLDGPHPDLVQVLEFSQALAARSDGAFDVTVQPLWACHEAARRQGRRPSPAEHTAALALVGWRGLEVSAGRVRLARPGMGITLNGVAQGYAADLALAELRSLGVQDALVDAGEHGADGRPQPGEPWRVGVQHPRDPSALLGAVALEGRCLATSGDYASAFTEDLSSHHVLDPRTGRSPPGLSAVTVVAASGMLADGLTKPLMILPRPAARRLLAAFPGAGALWADKAGRVEEQAGLELRPG